MSPLVPCVPPCNYTAASDGRIWVYTSGCPTTHTHASDTQGYERHALGRGAHTPPAVVCVCDGLCVRWSTCVGLRV